MSLIRIYAIALRHFYLVRGSFSRFLPLFMWVGVDVILWGFISKYLSHVTDSGIDFAGQFLGAILLWGFFIRVLHGVTLVCMEDVWSRNFFNVFASPLTTPEYLSGLVLSSIATSSIGLIVMLLLVTGVFGLSLSVYGASLIAFLFVLFLFGIAIGILGCAIMLRFGPAGEWFIWPIPAILAPFAGVFYPITVLPHWMQALAHALPPAYVFQGLRAVVAGRPFADRDLLYGAGLAALYILAACLLFARIYRHALKTGLIARYSAESLS